VRQRCSQLMRWWLKTTRRASEWRKYRHRWWRRSWWRVDWFVGVQLFNVAVWSRSIHRVEWILSLSDFCHRSCRCTRLEFDVRWRWVGHRWRPRLSENIAWWQLDKLFLSDKNELFVSITRLPTFSYTILNNSSNLNRLNHLPTKLKTKKYQNLVIAIFENRNVPCAVLNLITNLIWCHISSA